MRDERKNLNSNLEMWLWAGLALLGIHLYVALSTFFANMGLSHPFSDKLLENATAKPNVLTAPWTLKLLGGLCITAYGATSHGVKSMTLKAAPVFRALLENQFNTYIINMRTNKNSQ